MAGDSKMTSDELTKQVRFRIMIFMAGLVVSGITAFPIESELRVAVEWIGGEPENILSEWLGEVYDGVSNTNAVYPFISYGSDWLGFAHLVIAIAFIGPLRDPLRNRWVIEFGLIACAAIFPFAFIAGHIRHIPVFWRVIDWMFGLVGGWLLWSCYERIKTLEKYRT